MARRLFKLGPEAVPDEGQLKQAQSELAKEARAPFTGELNGFVEDVRKSLEQIIDTVNLDEVTYSGWNAQTREHAQGLIADFAAFIEAHKDEIMALSIYYSQPWRRRELTFTMVNECMDILRQRAPQLHPAALWQAYHQVEKVNGTTPEKELTMLVSLIRRTLGIDSALTSYEATVNRNFQQWVFGKHAGDQAKFSEEQMAWLRMIKDHVAGSFHIDRDDLDYAPFDAAGGLARMYQLFGDDLDRILDELNEVLAA